VREIRRAAFADHPHSKQAEHLIVDACLPAITRWGACGCVLVGDPDFYGRLGFHQAEGVTCEGVPKRNIRCVDFGHPVPAGELLHHEAFDISTSCIR